MGLEAYRTQVTLECTESGLGVSDRNLLLGTGSAVCPSNLFLMDA
jgi:hypothetical protein